MGKGNGTTRSVGSGGASGQRSNGRYSLDSLVFGNLRAEGSNPYRFGVSTGKRLSEIEGTNQTDMIAIADSVSQYAPAIASSPNTNISAEKMSSFLRSQKTPYNFEGDKRLEQAASAIDAYVDKIEIRDKKISVRFKVKVNS